jgi:AcrR family transcriptional regulator
MEPEHVATFDDAPADARRTDTHERILDVALRLFAERGFAGTSIRDIADELGVTKAALYYHFASKDAIFAELVEQPLAAAREIMAETHDLDTASGREEFVRKIVNTMADYAPVVAMFKDPQLIGAVGAELAQSGILRDLALQLAMGKSGTTHPEDVSRKDMIRAIGAVSAAVGAIENWQFIYPDREIFTPDDKAAIAELIVATLEA